MPFKVERLLLSNSTAPAYVLEFVNDTLRVGKQANAEVLKKRLSCLFTVLGPWERTFFIRREIPLSCKNRFLSRWSFAEIEVRLECMSTAKLNDAHLLQSHPLYKKKKTLTMKDLAVIRNGSYRQVLGLFFLLGGRTRPVLIRAFFKP